MQRGLIAMLLVAFLTTACNTTIPTTTVVLDAVGPQVAGPRYAPNGYLRIFTETTNSRLDGLDYSINTPYWVYNEAGKKVLTVQNQVGGNDMSPMLALLPPGKYRVVARAAGYGLVTLPVVIQGGMLTEAWLLAGGLQHTGNVPAADLVRLPNGTAVGFRAKEPVKKPSKSTSPAKPATTP